MSQIAVVNIGMHGHVNPTLGFTRELVQRGHKVQFLSTSDFASSIEATGAEFFAYPSVLGQAVASTARIQAENASLGQPPPKSMSILARFIQEFATTFPVLFKFFSANKPDIVVYDFVSLATWIIAKHFRIKTIKFYTTYASNAHYDLMRETFAKHEMPTPEELMKVQQMIDQVCGQFGCNSVSLTEILGHVDDDNLVFMPRSFQPFGETFDKRFHFVGPCIRPAFHKDVLSIVPQGDGPIMTIALGTLYHEWPEFYQSCIQAFGDSPWRVVMAIGKLDPKTLGSIPSNFKVMPHIPLIELLQYSDLFISHGGMNSTMEAGYFGVPLVVIPQIEEQEVTAMRVQEMGIGRHIKRTEMTTESLRMAVEQVLNSNDIRSNMKAMQQDILQCGGSTRAADLVEINMGINILKNNRYPSIDLSHKI